MKPWERQRLEYRPRIGYTPSILSRIIEQEATEEAETFRPSLLSIRTTQYVGADMMDNLIATLSHIHDMLSTMDKCLSHQPAYRAYHQAKADGNHVMAQEIHLSNIGDIKGIPQMDVIPFLEDMKDEMEAYLDFINRELFDGRADLNDTSGIRKEEQEAIDAVIQREIDGKPIDYDKLRARIQVLATVHKRSEMYQSFTRQAEAYITSKAKDFLDEDIEGTLRYLHTLPEDHLPKIQETLAIEFRRNASNAVGAAINMKRSGGRDVREMLDRELSSVRKTLRDIADPLDAYRYADESNDPIGAIRLKGVFLEGIHTVQETFQFMTVEHISNTVLNNQQHSHLFGAFEDKRKAQTFHDLVGLVSESFDRTDVDREIPRFIKSHKLLTPGTYCG